MRAPDEVMWRIELPYAVFGVLTRNRVVVTAAPVGKWMVGWHIEHVKDWVSKRKGRIERVKG